jgi:hypothetical protein
VKTIALTDCVVEPGTGSLVLRLGGTRLVLTAAELARLALMARDFAGYAWHRLHDCTTNCFQRQNGKQVEIHLPTGGDCLMLTAGDLECLVFLIQADLGADEWHLEVDDDGNLIDPTRN